MKPLSLCAGVATVIAAVLTTVGCSVSPSSTLADAESGKAAVKPDRERKPAPDFTLRDSNGTQVKLSEYKGKVVLLDFWATWCGPCKVEIPWFMEFEQNYKDKGFAVLGVSMDEDGWNAVKPYIQERKMNYRVLMGDDVTSQLYGGLDSLPTTFLIDRSGRIAKVHIGLETGKDGFQNEIANLLSAPRAALPAFGPMPASITSAR